MARWGLGKGSTTPGRFEHGVIAVLGEAAPEEVEFLAHGTTVIINRLTEHKSAVTALVTTRLPRRARDHACESPRPLQPPLQEAEAIAVWLSTRTQTLSKSGKRQ
jgi:N-methylhydantoinase A/oxoprolinase/acetone carboxylase beta subunit